MPDNILGNLSPATAPLVGSEAVPCDQLVGSPVAATALVVGLGYRIVSVGVGTNWQACGVPAGVTAVAGLQFVCSAAGTGTGTANRVATVRTTPDQIAARAAGAIGSAISTHLADPAAHAAAIEAEVTAQIGTLGLGDSATRNVGTTAGSVAAGDDSRLSNARPPTAHASTHATGGADALTPGAIGAEPAGAAAAALSGHVAALPHLAAVTTAVSASQVLSVTNQAIGGVNPAADRLVFWNNSTSRLEHLPLGTGLSVTGGFLVAAAGSPGGSSGQTQFRSSAGAFAGASGLTVDEASGRLTLASFLPGAAPAPPASGFSLFADTSGRFGLQRVGGNSLTIDASALTEPQVIAFPDWSGTAMLQGDISVNSNLGQILEVDGALSSQISAINPGATRLLYWNNATNRFEFLSLGSGLSIYSGELSATGATGSIPIVDGYAPGRWTCGSQTNPAQGTTPGATNIIEMMPFRVQRSMVIDGLAGRVTTSSPGTSFQLAIYESTSQGDITGNPIIHTANMSAASTTIVQATTGLTPATATLEAYRLYWFAVAYGSSNIALTTQSQTDASSFYETSVENLSFWTGHTTVAITRRLTSVYGSWPNMTGASTTLISGNRGALPVFRIASLP